jgi:hypothetical protein
MHGDDLYREEMLSRIPGELDLGNDSGAAMSLPRRLANKLLRREDCLSPRGCLLGIDQESACPERALLLRVISVLQSRGQWPVFHHAGREQLPNLRVRMGRGAPPL